MHLEILTPERKFFEGEVELIQVPGSREKGAFEILENHAPIVSSLQPGKVKMKVAGAERNFVIKGGFIEAANNQVSLLVEGIEEH